MRSRRTQVKADIAALAALEEAFWRQKSCALYVKEGDNNTKFFHILANSHRRSNHIRSIEDLLYNLRWFSSIKISTKRQICGVQLWMGWIFCLHWRG